MIEVSATIKDHLLDPLGHCLFGHSFADLLGRCYVSASLQLHLQCRCRRQRLALLVVDHLRVDVVGYGSGKAKEVPQAIRKGIESAKKNLVKVHLTETTIPHQVLGRFGSGQVLLKPAPEGTGVIAGGAVRAVMTSAGVQNVLTKSIGSPNPHNVVKATFDALAQLRDKAEVATARGKQVEEL